MIRGKYVQDRREAAAFLRSKEAGEASMEVAQRLAGNAQAVGRGEYEAVPATVVGGWNNERRAGASVRETRRDYRDTRDEILLRVADAMKEAP